jgi:hypothetical protein
MVLRVLLDRVVVQLRVVDIDQKDEWIESHHTALSPAARKAKPWCVGRSTSAVLRRPGSMQLIGRLPKRMPLRLLPRIPRYLDDLCLHPWRSILPVRRNLQQVLVGHSVTADPSRPLAGISTMPRRNKPI